MNAVAVKRQSFYRVFNVDDSFDRSSGGIFIRSFENAARIVDGKWTLNRYVTCSLYRGNGTCAYTAILKTVSFRGRLSATFGRETLRCVIRFLPLVASLLRLRSVRERTHLLTGGMRRPNIAVGPDNRDRSDARRLVRRYGPLLLLCLAICTSTFLCDAFTPFALIFFIYCNGSTIG